MSIIINFRRLIDQVIKNNWVRQCGLLDVTVLLRALDYHTILKYIPTLKESVF